MGYVTHLSGELTIQPPLTYGELRDQRSWLTFKQDDHSYRSLCLETTESEVETPDGRLLSRTSSTVRVFDLGDGRYGPDDVATDIAALVNAFPDHVFTGRIHYEGEENGDLAKIIVDFDAEHTAHSVRIVRPEIRWPE